MKRVFLHRLYKSSACRHHKGDRSHIWIAVLILFHIAVLPLAAQFSEAAEIIREMEERTVFDSAFVQGRLVINDRFGKKTSTFDSYSLGTEYSLLEFTSVEERGQKILRSEDDLYIYYPDAEEIVRLFGSALGEGILGSDASYEDITGDKSLLTDYEITAFRTETVDGKDLARIELKARNNSVPYPRQIIWIDENRNGIRSEKYSLSNRLIKEEEVLNFTTVGQYVVPSHLRVNDTLKKNSYSEFIMDEIDINYRLDEGFFSLDELTF